MVRYVRLLLAFYKSSILTELEYRTNFLINAGQSVFWLCWSIFGLGIFFSHSPSIGGWSYNEALIVVGLYTFFNGFMSAVLRPNITRIVEHIQKGTLDFVLLKPVDSLFMSSLREIVIWRAVDMLLGGLIIGVALGRLEWELNLLALLFFALLLAAAAVMIYSLWIVLITLAFWFVRVDNITEIFNATFEAGRYPVQIFPGWMRAGLTFFIPIAFITTFPAASLIGRLPWEYGLYAGALAGALLLGATRFWRFALRHYTSASS
jgi:ABC-2 type transport system permease protein